MKKKKIFLLGKLPPPYMGPSIATEIILKSKLNDYYTLYHVDTNVHQSLSTLGIWESRKVWKNLYIYFKFVRMVICHKPDLVLIPVSQTTLGFLKDSIFIVISKLFFRKVLIQLRGSNFKNWYRETWTITQIYVFSVLKTCHGVVVLGDKLKNLFSDFFKDDHIFVVPNGANYNITDKKKINKIPKILYLSNLQPSKGIEDVIDAIGLLNTDSQLNYCIEIVGEWRDERTKNKCMAKVKNNNLPSSFYPPAFNKEKFKFLANADIFVFPPREPEGHPWAIVEALAAGLPIISTDQGAITESVIDSVNGFIVAKKNPKELADKLKILLNNHELRRKMGLASRQHYLNNFTEDKMVEKMRSCFNTVLEK